MATVGEAIRTARKDRTWTFGGFVRGGRHFSPNGFLGVGNLGLMGVGPAPDITPNPDDLLCWILRFGVQRDPVHPIRLMQEGPHGRLGLFGIASPDQQGRYELVRPERPNPHKKAALGALLCVHLNRPHFEADSTEFSLPSTFYGFADACPTEMEMLAAARGATEPAHPHLFPNASTGGVVDAVGLDEGKLKVVVNFQTHAFPEWAVPRVKDGDVVKMGDPLARLIEPGQYTWSQLAEALGGKGSSRYEETFEIVRAGCRQPALDGTPWKPRQPLVSLGGNRVGYPIEWFTGGAEEFLQDAWVKLDQKFPSWRKQRRGDADATEWRLPTCQVVDPPMTGALGALQWDLSPESNPFFIRHFLGGNPEASQEPVAPPQEMPADAGEQTV